MFHKPVTKYQYYVFIFTLLLSLAGNSVWEREHQKPKIEKNVLDEFKNIATLQADSYEK